MKTCNKCGESKPYNDFYKHKAAKDGFTSDCKECRKAKSKAYREANPEKVRESIRTAEAKKHDYYSNQRKQWYTDNRTRMNSLVMKRYYANHAEKLVYHREYHSRNREEISEKKKVYYRNNPELFKYHRRLRKSKERLSGVELNYEDYESIMRRFDGKCCLTESADIHLDHFIPVWTGFGKTSKSNLIPLDSKLNLSKGGKNPFEWVKTQNVDIEKFNKIVSYLAQINELTVDEYRGFVYSCFGR